MDLRFHSFSQRSAELVSDHQLSLCMWLSQNCSGHIFFQELMNKTLYKYKLLLQNNYPEILAWFLGLSDFKSLIFGAPSNPIACVSNCLEYKVGRSGDGTLGFVGNPGSDAREPKVPCSIMWL